MGCCLSQLCMLLCTCFLLLLLLNFHFYFLFYFKKDFLHNIPLLFCLLTINILPSFNLSQTLPGLSQTCLFFQHEIFPSATFPLSALNLPMYHNKKYFNFITFLNSVNLSICQLMLFALVIWYKWLVLRFFTYFKSNDMASA